MRHVWIDARAKFLGHDQAGRIFDITSKKRPSLAYGWLALVNAAAFVLEEKNAASVISAADFQFSAGEFAVAGLNVVRRQAKMAGQSA